MKNFAKLFDTDETQILVMIMDAADDVSIHMRYDPGIEGIAGALIVIKMGDVEDALTEAVTFLEKTTSENIRPTIYAHRAMLIEKLRGTEMRPGAVIVSEVVRDRTPH